METHLPSFEYWKKSWDDVEGIPPIPELILLYIFEAKFPGDRIRRIRSSLNYLRDKGKEHIPGILKKIVWEYERWEDGYFWSCDQLKKKIPETEEYFERINPVIDFFKRIFG